MTNNIATWLTNQINNQGIIPSTDVIQLTLTHYNTYLALWRLFPTSWGQLNKDSFIDSLLLLSPKNVHPGEQSIGSTQSWQPEAPFYRQGSVILRYILRCLRFSCSLKNSWLIISAVDYVNDILSFMIYFHPYYTRERPVRSIIIINIFVIVVVIIIYYCYRIIVISCPHYLCVVWLVSITRQKKGWYSWLYSLAGTIKTNQNSF